MPNRLYLKSQRAIDDFEALTPTDQGDLIRHLESIQSDPTPDEHGDRVVPLYRPPIVLYVYTESPWVITYSYWYDLQEQHFVIAVYRFEKA